MDVNFWKEVIPFSGRHWQLFL